MWPIATIKLLSALRCSWIIPLKIITFRLLFILASYGELISRYLIQLLLVWSGDIEINPGPTDKNRISFCHRDLNSLAVHNFTKVSLLQTLSVTHDYDISLTETFLDLPILKEDERIIIKGHYLLQADHPSN